MRTFLITAIGLVFALFAVIGLAETTPSGGTISPANPVLQFQGGPFAVSNPSSPTGDNPPVCTDATPCGVYALKVAIPAGDPDAYDVKVSVAWAESGQPTTQGGTASDYDIFVYQPSAPTGASAGAQGPNANPQESTFRVASGDYTIYVVPYDVAPDVPFTATVTMTKVGAEATPTPPPLSPDTPTFTAYMSPQGVGDSAGEPSIGVNWKTGKVLYYGGFLTYMLRVTFDDTKLPASALWEKKDLLLAASPRALGDPILFTDRETGRTFASQLEGGTKQNTMDITDDDGETLQLSVGSGINSGYDHQTLGGGPFAPGLSSINGYKNAVYYCAQDAVVANCAISVDGGVTFGPAVPMSNISECTAIHGHIKVAPDGTAYVPDRSCGGAQGVIVSEDNGTTWKVRKVPGSTGGEWDPSVGVASDGTVYFGYNAADGRAFAQVSHDKGVTWTQPFDVGAQLGIKNIVFPAVVAGEPDRASFAFIGTTTGGNYNANEFTGTWYLYVASTLDGGQTWNTVNATPNDPVQRGRICTDGTTCAAPGGGGDTRNLLDFMDATIDEKGRVLVGYADGCITAACIRGDKNGDGKNDTLDNDLTAKAAIARQSGGLRMFKQFDTTGPTPYAPTAQDDAATTNENTPVTINVLANDSDPNGDALTVSGVTQGAHGAVVNNGNGVTYKPATNFYGGDQFTYTVSDPGGLSNTATVKVAVNPFCPSIPNGRFFDDAETAKPGYETTNTRTTGGWTQMIDLNAHSPKQAWVALDEQPGVPTGTQKDATLVLPAQDLGASSTLTFWHNYDFARFPLATPETANQSGGVLEISADGNTWIDLGGFISTGGYTGIVDDGAMSPLKGRQGWVGSSDGNTMPGRLDAMKKVVVNLGAAIQAKYGVTELRNARLRFRLGGTFQALIGGIQGSGWGIDDIEVANTLTVSNCNRPPVAEDDSATTTRNSPVTINVTANDSDPEDDTITVSAATQPSHGAVKNNGDGTITYTPATRYVGADSFNYTLSDGNGNTDTAQVNVNVADTPNTPPTAANDSATTDQDVPVSVAVLANDSDPDDDILTVSSVTSGSHGAVTNNGDGTLTYTPNAGYYGADSFGYAVSDGRGGTASATVSVTVNRVTQNAPPDAVDDSATTVENTAVTVNVIANDSDANGDKLTVTGSTHGSNGTVSNNGNGTLTYTPNNGFVGSDSFNYTVSDGKGGADTAAVTVIVNQSPNSTGRVSGGGWIPGGNGQKANFNFDAKVKDLARSKINYDNSGGGIWLSGKVDYVTASGTRGEFGGACQLGDGSAGRYTVQVEDNGEPGKGTDRFTIKVYNALGSVIHRATGILGGGNIQVKQ